jgi:transposase
MFLVGYFEGIESQRGIAWWCTDSLSIQNFLGIAMGEQSPDHSTLSVIRGRLPEEVQAAIFHWVFNLARVKKLLDGRRVGVDSTTFEAGEIADKDHPTDDDLRKFDRKRLGKTVSNDDWVSETDGDARIAKMKNGTTHLAYNVENAVYLASGVILAAEIYYADDADTKTIEDTINTAQANLLATGGGDIREVAADKGYHSGEVIETFVEETRYRLYVAEKPLPEGKKHRWKRLTEVRKKAVRNH